MADDRTADALAHHFRLVIDNDEGLYLYRRELVGDALRDEFPRAVLCDSLRDWFEELMGVELNGLQRELLSVVRDTIDWWSMADDYIEEEGENA